MGRCLPAALLAFSEVVAASGFPAGSDCAVLGAVDIVEAYRELAEASSDRLAGLAGQAFVVRVDDPETDRWASDPLPGGRWRLTYRMGRNQVTEGWNWHPGADPAREDYYRYQYLPLGQMEAETAPARIVDDPAVGSYLVSYVRRDAYYFAFDNPYEFYARGQDDGGFAIEAPAPRFALVARGRHVAPHHAESTTYWRADPGRKVDLTLKNRYFMGQLDTVWFCSPDGRLLGTLGR